MTNSPHLSVSQMELKVLDELRDGTGGLPDAWRATDFATQRQVAAMNARVAKTSTVFVDPKSLRPNLDFTADNSVKSARFVSAVMDDDFDW